MTRKQIRETAGLTQAELAKKLGVGRATVQRFEYGQSSNKKLQEYYAKQEKINIREQYNFTQREIARGAGVSVSTVSKFERGISKSKKLQQFYKNMQNNADLWVEFDTSRKEAIKRLRELETVDFSPARQWLDDRGLVPKPETIGLSRRDLKKAISDLERFLDMQTSTVQGTKEWEKNVEEASMQTSMSGSEDENVIFWNLFNRLKNNKTLSRYWGKGYFDSDQAVEDIQSVMVYSYAGYETADELYDILIKEFG